MLTKNYKTVHVDGVYITNYVKTLVRIYFDDSFDTSLKVPSGSPTEVTYGATSESLAIEWQQPTCGSRGGNILGYRYSLMDRAGGFIIEEGTTNETSVDITGLEPCGEYQFGVYAMTGIGRGPETASIDMDTDAVGK